MRHRFAILLGAVTAACSTGPADLTPITTTPPLANVFAELPATARSFARSDTLPLTIRNARAEQVGLSFCVSVLERRLPAGWFIANPPPGPTGVCAASLQVLDPGASTPLRWPLPRNPILTAGRYRMRFPDVFPLVFVPVRDSSGIVTDEFDVR